MTLVRVALPLAAALEARNGLELRLRVANANDWPMQANAIKEGLDLLNTAILTACQPGREGTVPERAAEGQP